MTDRLMRHLNAARAAIVAGNSDQALACLEQFAAAADRSPEPDRRPALQARINELHRLALAAQTGARMAMDQVAAIVESARSLQTYDRLGARNVAMTTAPLPRRY